MKQRKLAVIQKTILGLFLYFLTSNANASMVTAQCHELFSFDTVAIVEAERAHAQQIAKSTPKLGAYSRISVGLNKEILNIVSDANAGWLKISIEKYLEKPIEQINQNDVKKYLSFIAEADLGDLITPRLHAYRGVDRPVLRDGETYYLEELMASGKHRDLSLALIGQMLFETFAKKEARLVQTTQNAKPIFAVLLNGKSPEVFAAGVCESGSCTAPFTKVALTLTEKAPAPSKDQKQVSLYDMYGRLQTLNVVGRTPLERLIKADEDQFQNAGPEDLVAVESYFVTQHRPAGSTAFRVGETIFHFGGEGWGIYRGTEKVKGFLVSNPYLRHNAQEYASLKVPSFNVGVIMMVPKKHVTAFLAGIETEMSLPPEQQVKFDYYKSNCNHVPLCHFRDAGIPMGSPTGISGFSTSATARAIFLNPPYPVRSKNIYPLAGVDLTEAQMRDLFPPLLYRHHTLKHDGQLLNLSENEITRWRQATILNIIKNNHSINRSQLYDSFKEAGQEVTPHAFDRLVDDLFNQALITNIEEPRLTAAGTVKVKENQKDYLLP